jgi:hypothetical protein
MAYTTKGVRKCFRFWKRCVRRKVLSQLPNIWMYFVVNVTLRELISVPLSFTENSDD